MKTHKIRGIDKAICTAEQKLAYNFVWSWSLNSDHLSGGELYECIRNDILQRENIITKYNVDAILTAIMNGLVGYREHKFIASSYAEIGKAFPLN